MTNRDEQSGMDGLGFVTVLAVIVVLTIIAGFGLGFSQCGG